MNEWDTKPVRAGSCTLSGHRGPVGALWWIQEMRWREEGKRSLGGSTTSTSDLGSRVEMYQNMQR